MTAKDRDLLVRFVAIAGQADNDGEAINALRHAVRLAAANGLELAPALASAGAAIIDMTRLAHLEADAFKRGHAAAQDEACQRAATARSWQDAVQDLQPFLPAMNAKSASFVSSLLGRGYSSLTIKQDAWLRDLCSRFGVAPW